MDYNTINWYEFILNNHFKERNTQPPPFFTLELVAFKLPSTPNPPKTVRDKKVFEAKQTITSKIHTMPTSQLLNIIYDTSFIHF
jgi:hypothetical protein